MGYTHTKHAGNRGDVWKHAVLCELLSSIPLSEDGPGRTKFSYAESHCGLSTHVLSEGEDGEWNFGVRSLLNSRWEGSYRTAVQGSVDQVQREYPSSWRQAVRVLRGRKPDHLDVVLCDTDVKVEESALHYYLNRPDGPAVNYFQFYHEDGYTTVRRNRWMEYVDLLFMDPPYSPKGMGDWGPLTATVMTLLSRPPIGHGRNPVCVWYPLYAENASMVARFKQDLEHCLYLEARWTSIWAYDMVGCGMMLSPALEEVVTKAMPALEDLAMAMEFTVLMDRPARIGA